MNEVKIFKNSQFGDIRMVQVNDEPYFVGSDVARALGYSQPDKAIISHTDEDDRTKHTVTDTLGRLQDTYVINESGMYSLVMSSKLPQAKQFKKWVTGEVLPSIRKHGAYMSDNFIEQAVADPDFAIRIISEMKEERIKRIAAEEKAKAQQVLLDEAQPMINFTQTFVMSKSSVTVAEMAKMLRQAGNTTIMNDGILKGMGQNTFYQWLRENHYLGCRGEYYNIPNQTYMAQGLFELKKTMHTEGERLVTSTTTKVTAKGQMYFLNKFCKNG